VAAAAVGALAALMVGRHKQRSAAGQGLQPAPAYVMTMGAAMMPYPGQPGTLPAAAAGAAGQPLYRDVPGGGTAVQYRM
jgi:hypothetical protein